MIAARHWAQLMSKLTVRFFALNSFKFRASLKNLAQSLKLAKAPIFFTKLSASNLALTPTRTAAYCLLPANCCLLLSAY
jgi:hypothetical protein